jgi:transcriptional regulator GlxA family with amidase domain
MREDLAMTSRAHRVAVIALPGVYPFELSIPARVFGCARGPDDQALYEVVTCSVDGGSVASSADFIVVAQHDLSALGQADTVIVPPAAPMGPAMRTGEPDAAEVLVQDALCSLDESIRIASICSGADVLANAGLLDDRRATTHWRTAEEFQRRHPSVQVDPNVLYVDDGNVLTSAGAASGIDLCLHLIRCDHGTEVANQVARSCVVPPHRDGGQAQYIDRPMPNPALSSTAATRTWALRRLETSLTLASMADHAAMSVRTFTRRFREEVGVSPNRWIIQQRVELARRLLETSDLGVDLVAQRAGLGTAASLRLHMNATIGVSPSAYRRTFARPSAS